MPTRQDPQQKWDWEASENGISAYYYCFAQAGAAVAREIESAGNELTPAFTDTLTK
jgi:hypothetical protein